MNSRPADLSMIVPTYNERERLAELTTALFDAAAAADLALELIIVDDNSPDGTGPVADELARTRRMTVVHRASKLGLGSAVIAGFSVASADVVGVMDGDFSHPPPLVPLMYAALHSTGADMLIASRYVRGGSTPGWPARRRWMSRLACVMAQPITPIRDATSGFFLIRQSAARGVQVQARGFKIALELIVRARPGLLLEVPYRFDNRELGESKMTMREGTGYLVQLKELYRWSWRHRGATRSRYRRMSAEDLRRRQ